MTEFLEPEPMQPTTPQRAMRSDGTNASAAGDWLTTGEAYSAALAHGWQGSKGTFRRRLEGRSIPPDLAAIGLAAEFDRRDANPKSNAVRWLRFDS